MKYFVLLVLLITFNGCLFQVKEQVKPWQKGILAKDTMTQSGGNNLLYKFQKHIYFSKEGSKGGGGVAGGGCGCN